MAHARYWELLRPAFAVAISIIFLPLSLLALAYNYGALILCPQDKLRRKVRRSPRFRPRNVLITGISTPVGLRVARAFYYTGHHVIGVDDLKHRALAFGRWSKAVSVYRLVPSPQGLPQLIVENRIDLWLDCSDEKSTRKHALLKRSIEQQTNCICLVPDTASIQQLETPGKFQQLAQMLGLPSPEFYSVTSRNDIYNVLKESNGKRYLLSDSVMHTMLPCETVNKTYQNVAKLKLSKSTPSVMEQYMGELPQFTACAIVIRGKAEAFSCLDEQHKAVPGSVGLGEAMKQYMETFAAAIGPDFSSALTMQFCVEERTTHAGVVQQVLPVHARPVMDQSLLLLNNIKLSRAYMSAFSTNRTTELQSYTGLPFVAGDDSVVLLPPDSETGIYTIVEDVKRLVVEPLLQFFTLKAEILQVARSYVTFLHHLVAWQETLYELGDPLPLFWYLHVCKPWATISEVVRNYQIERMTNGK